MRFDLTDLRLCLLVADAGSITGGAERAHLTLASASARIRGLEETLGVALFMRHRQGVIPTPAGRALLAHARRVLAQIEQMRGELGEYAAGLKGNVRIASNTVAMSEFLPDLLGAFLAEHPNVEIALREQTSPAVVQAVLEGAADIGIVSDWIELTGLETVPFRQDRLVVVTPPGHALAALHEAHTPREVAFVDVLDSEFIGLPEHSALAEHLDGHAKRAGRLLRYRLRLRDFDSLCRAVAAGAAPGIVPLSAARRSAASLDIGIVPLSDPWALRTLVLCVRERDALPVYARQLLEWLASPVAANENGTT
ncbi:LysR substrate-binding domain-containing protein [Pandoraea apista]|uniref:LysR substrate-binding domain-containing protein n=1 Tax=Pandoraea apista TaxID=93218 RepID=UPI000F68DCE5|nr:LysR substrate-binding domain-containing protein [Pandoraea apista]RRW96321.1 LysR family transcriptional regulator [Pandoraea apista]RRX03513.1 LysR family transcriptional regulator [Pandoraea apista]